MMNWLDQDEFQSMVHLIKLILNINQIKKDNIQEYGVLLSMVQSY